LSTAAGETAQYWRDLCPKLTVGGDRTVARGQQCLARVSDSRARDLRAILVQEGTFQLDAKEMGWEESPTLGIEALREGAEAVMAAGWPASFILMYDEAWEVIAAVRELMQQTTGSSSMHRA